MRCVPFLLFAYIVYYGLPSFGIRFTNWTAGLVALTLYNTAYMAELLRGAWAGAAARDDRGRPRLRLCRAQPVPPHRAAAGDLRGVPMIGNQLIQIIKDSAFLTIIAVPELTHEASSIQATYFVPFAAFIPRCCSIGGCAWWSRRRSPAVGRMAEARR